MRSCRPISLREAAQHLGVGPRKLTALLVERRMIRKTEFGYEALAGWESLLITRESAYFHQGLGCYRHCTSVKVTDDGMTWLYQQINNQGNA